jgi:hypothetical protein
MNGKLLEVMLQGHSTTAASESHNINTASTAYDGVKYISPTILINHDDVAGETYIDYIVVREYQTDIPNSKGWYSTLNRKLLCSCCCERC